MLSGSMPDGGIGISSLPGENGCAIDNQIASANQPTPQGREHTEHKEGLGKGGSGLVTSLPLLRGAGNAGLPILSQRQATGQG